MESKTQLYNRMMSQIAELKPDFIESASLAIQKRLLLMEEFRLAVRIGIYMVCGNEVKTDFLFLEANKYRKELYYPFQDEATSLTSYFRVSDLDEFEALKQGQFRGQKRLRDFNTLDLLIVPGAAFDVKGGRMGFEKDIYEKCLISFTRKRVAFAYDFQLIPELPLGIRGRKVDSVVTETRIVQCGADS